MCIRDRSSVLSRSVLLRDVVVGKIFFLRPDRISFVVGVQRSDSKVLCRPLHVLAGPGHVVGRRSRRERERER